MLMILNILTIQLMDEKTHVYCTVPLHEFTWFDSVVYVSHSQHTQDISPKCQVLLKEAFRWCELVSGHSARSPCLFGDITEMLPYGTLVGCETYSSKLQQVFQSKLTNRLHCYQHSHSDSPSTTCSPFKKSQFDCSGLPCPDMSRANHKRQKRAGPTNSVYMVHGKWATEHRVPLLLVECTPES